MQSVDTSRRPVFRRFWIIGLAAAMLVGPTLAIASQSANQDKDHKKTSQKHDKAAGHSAKGSEHAGNTRKEGKESGHSKKGSGGSNLLQALEKAANTQSSGQDDQ